MENARIRIVIKRVFNRGSDIGEGERRRGRRLTGRVRAQTQRVRVIRGAERWSVKKRGFRVSILLNGKYNEEDRVDKINVVIGKVRQVRGVKSKGVRRRGIRIFSIY